MKQYRVFKMKGEGSSVKQLINYFDALLPLSDEEKELVLTCFKPRQYRRKQYLLQEGDVCNQFNFVAGGCLRMYKVDEKGNMHIIQFAAENWWIIDVGSFHGRKPSELNIDALEDTLVLQISYDNLITLYTQAPRFNRIFRVLIENSYAALQKRLLLTISSTAEERYQGFVDTYPHLINRLPQTQIASFLGITPEFLSRMRNKSGRQKS